MNRVKNKVALVTGAAQGIGAACAELLVQEGAEVILTDINDAKGEATAAKIGGKAKYMHLDVADETKWQSLAADIKANYGGLDILVNNAGVTGFGEDWGDQDPEHTSLEAWHKVHAINLDGVFLGCKYGIQLMQQSKSACIINMSSRSGIVGIPLAAAYASSKAAVRNHSKSVALYCAQKGYPIRCNSVHPGAILTPLWEPMLGDVAERKDNIAAIAADIPLGTMGEPMDVAYAVVYLASDEAKYITGVELTIDGGILAGASATPQKR